MMLLHFGFRNPKQTKAKYDVMKKVDPDGEYDGTDYSHMIAKEKDMQLIKFRDEEVRRWKKTLDIIHPKKNTK